MVEAFSVTPGRAPTGNRRGLSSGFARLAELLEAERPQWALWCPVLVAAGALMYFTLPVEPDGWLVVGGVAGLMISALIARGSVLGSLVVGGLLLATLGVAAAKLRVEAVRAPIWSGDTRVADVSGRVEHVEAREEGGVRIMLRPWSVGGLGPEAVPQRVRLTIREPRGPLMPGDAISVRARLSAPPAPAVPGGYDFARLAYFQQIGAVGFAVAAPRPAVAPDEAGVMQLATEAVARLRKAIGARVSAVLPGATGAIATALITGERGGIPQEINEAFRASGLFHVLSISGLHMAIMGGSVLVALRAGLALVPAIALNVPIKKWAAAGAILASLGYLLISGGAFATVRSFLMIAVMLVAVIVDRPALALRNVALSALLILAVFPESVVDVGFQMSFAAVVALVAGHEAVSPRFEPSGDSVLDGLRRPVYWLLAIVASTLLASAAVAPLAIYHFQQTQHYAVLGNLLGVPICNLIVMPAALACLVLMPFGLEGVPLVVMGAGIEAMVIVARWVAGLGGAVGRVAAIPDAAILTFVFGGLWLALMRRRWRWAGGVAMAAGLVLVPFGEQADVLIAGDGRLIAVRDGQGRLAVAGDKGNGFTLSRWLERDGDARSAESVVAGGAPFRCDAVGCRAVIAGHSIGIVTHPGGIREDCARTTILVYAGEAPPWCTGPMLLADSTLLAVEGPMSVRLGPGAMLQIDSTRRRQGDRPWRRLPQEVRNGQPNRSAPGRLNSAE
ncbi:MAG: ComEC/Rec2 family competence protein [Hyphomicrobiaceae bacterium]|nr:ComEC/Rec2 family competence protein [Hyphomicrobiaceae bacterium]